MTNDEGAGTERRDEQDDEPEVDSATGQVVDPGADPDEDHSDDEGKADEESKDSFPASDPPAW